MYKFPDRATDTVPVGVRKASHPRGCNLLLAQRGFELNVSALRAQDEALDTLVNLIE